MAVYRSARGTPVDLDKLRLKSEDNISVGNTRTNARGDVLGKGGAVVKTADEIAREHYNRNNPKAVKRASIKVDEEKKTTKPVEDDWIDPPSADPVGTAFEKPEVDPNYHTDAVGEIKQETVEVDGEEWVEDEDGNFVKKEDLK